MAHNRLLITCLDGLAEAADFVPRLRPVIARFFDLLRAGPLTNDVFRLKVPKLFDRDFMP